MTTAVKEARDYVSLQPMKQGLHEYESTDPLQIVYDQSRPPRAAHRCRQPVGSIMIRSSNLRPAHCGLSIVVPLDAGLVDCCRVMSLIYYRILQLNRTQYQLILVQHFNGFVCLFSFRG